jgi:uncharacterized protein
MLRVDIRDLQKGPVRTDGTLQPDDPTFEGLELELDGPVEVRGQMQAAGDGQYLWRGDIRAAVRGECRRCLTDVRDDVDVHVDAAVFTSDPDAADDPDFYQMPARATSVDVSDVVREELALAAPAHLMLCRDECAGLCPTCGADLNAGPCGCARPTETV